MKVVKCIDHIPKELWGKVLINSEDAQSYISELKNDELFVINYKSDTFPLPKQGDPVEVSDDGVNWEGIGWDEDDKDNIPLFVCYNQLAKEDPFVICESKRPQMSNNYQYIRPLNTEKEKYHTTIDINLYGELYEDVAQAIEKEITDIELLINGKSFKLVNNTLKNN